MLVVFVVLAIALSWQRNLQLIPWIATLAAVTTAIALIIATRVLVPLTAGLLAIALVTEVAACFEHRLTREPSPQSPPVFPPGSWCISSRRPTASPADMTPRLPPPSLCSR